MTQEQIGRGLGYILVYASLAWAALALVAFVNWNFNPSTWHPVDRFTAVALFGCFCYLTRDPSKYGEDE